MKHSRKSIERKTRAIPNVQFEQQQLTSFAGLVILKPFLAAIDFMASLRRCFRHKSGERIVDEMRQLREQLGIRFFFGTEATAFDAWKNRDLLKLGRRSGLRALWLGIEDMTATLIKKGQSVNRTAELFGLLNGLGILPMPMMMHHDGQPLYAHEGMYGLLNQVGFLRKSGAQSLQVTLLTPAVGTRSFEANYENAWVFDTVGGRPVLQYQFDGNNVVASSLARPWQSQLNMLPAYVFYYNPLNLARALIRPANKIFLVDAYDQIGGMIGLGKTALCSMRWAYRLWRGPITRRTTPPGPKTPLIDVSSSRKERMDRVERQTAQPRELVPLGFGETAESVTAPRFSSSEREHSTFSTAS